MYEGFPSFMYRDLPPKRPPCNRIAPLAPRAGISRSAVILLERFLMFMKVFSSMPCAFVERE